MVLALPVGASAPYQTYTYSISGTALYSPDAYVPAKSIDSAYMGLSDSETLAKYHPDVTDSEKKSALMTLANPSDIEVDEAMNVYIADTDNNRIVVLDRYYRLKFIISNFINDQGVADSLTAPQGVFITEDKIVGTASTSPPAPMWRRFVFFCSMNPIICREN